MWFSLLALMPLLCPDARVQAEADELWNSGKRREAIAQLEAALLQEPQNTALRAGLVERELAVHRYRSAWQHLQVRDAQLDALRGRTLYHLGRYEEALPFLGTGSEQDCLARVDALEALGRFDEADEALEIAAKLFGENRARICRLRGQSLARQGKHAEALEQFRSAHALDPIDAQALFGLGRALLRTGDPEAGLAALEQHRKLLPLIDRYDFALKSLDLDPLHGPNHAELADVLGLLGQKKRAVEAYERAMQLGAGAEQLSPIALRYARYLLEQAGDLAAARLVMDSALERATDVRLLVRAGDYAGLAEDWDAAIQYFEQALQLRPTDKVIKERWDRAKSQWEAQAGR